MTSSIYALAVTPAATNIPVDTDILDNDIVITNDMVKPGGGGILRLYFSFVFDTSPGRIEVISNNSDKGTLNADNDEQIVENGFYRFDIDVESGDSINLQLKTSSPAAATQITGINFIRVHLVQFGA